MYHDQTLFHAFDVCSSVTNINVIDYLRRLFASCTPHQMGLSMPHHHWASPAHILCSINSHWHKLRYCPHSFICAQRNIHWNTICITKSRGSSDSTACRSRHGHKRFAAAHMGSWANSIIPLPTIQWLQFYSTCDFCCLHPANGARR